MLQQDRIGLLNRAVESKQKTGVAQTEEAIQVAIMDAATQGLGTITDTNLKTALNNNVGAGKYEITGDETNGWTVTVDGKDYNEQTNPVNIGQPYFVLVFGLDTGESSTSYQYCDYISIYPILNSIVLSPNEGNLLTRDENGYLYSAINWIEVQ